MTTTWTISEDIVWAGDDSIRLYDVNTGEFQTLNGTASKIWTLLAEGMSTDDIVARLAEQYSSGDPREKQVIDHDVRAFLREMSKQKAVIPVEARPGAGAARHGSGHE